jgi:hypothetical protein
MYGWIKSFVCYCARDLREYESYLMMELRFPTAPPPHFFGPIIIIIIVIIIII